MNLNGTWTFEFDFGQSGHDRQMFQSNGVLVSAYKDPADNTLAIVAINPEQEEKILSITFNGFTAATLTPHRTSASENLKKLDAINTTNEQSAFSATLPPESVTTFVGAGGRRTR